MDSFNINISDDIHICIRCKQAINGLDNYVIHRKRSQCVNMTADKFFNSLQLQQIHKQIHTELSHHNHNDSDDDNDNSRVTENNSYSDSSEVESEEDIYRPPNNFTGGKWKPGCGPQLIQSSNTNLDSFLTDYSYLHLLDSSEPELIVSDNVHDSEESIKKCKEIVSSDSKQNNSNVVKNQMNGPNDKSRNDCKTVCKISLDESECNAEEVITADNSSVAKLKCNTCEFEASDSIVLLKHYIKYELHQTDDSLCDAIVENELLLMKSLSFVCQLCNFYTNQLKNYLWHCTIKEHSVKAISKISVFKCQMCDHYCDNIEKLIEHLKNKQVLHSDSYGPLIVCEAKIDNNIKLTKSNSNLINIDIFKCDFCGQTFKFKTHLKKHTIKFHIRKVAFPDLIKSNFIGDYAKYSCQKCDFKTDSVATHLLHSVNHELPQNLNSFSNISNESIVIKRNDYKYKCPLCLNTYICRELKDHIYSHINEKRFDCVDCDKSFTKISYLRSHQKTHKIIKDKVCHICGSSFTSNKNLKNHMKTHENRVRNFVCNVCEVKFFSKSILNIHKKRHIPKSERQFKCQFQGCNYAFVHKNELTEHEKVHSDPEEKPFLCDRCPYKTKSIYTFRKHYRQHTGEKPFKCKFCDFTTCLSSNLSRHSRTHTGEKPYNCPYCSYSCNNQENIRKHILKTKKHFGLYVYPCEHCDHKTNVFNEYRKHIKQSHSDLFTQHQIDSLVSNLFTSKESNSQNSIINGVQ